MTRKKDLKTGRHIVKVTDRKIPHRQTRLDGVDGWFAKYRRNEL